MKLRASFHYDAGYSAPVAALSIRGKPRHIWPTVLVVAGCAHSEASADVPKGALQISVDEDPAHSKRSTLAEACVSRDAGALRAAVRAQLDYMLSSIHRLAVVDPERLVIFASGEAAPVAAAYVAEVRGKVLLGDPCIVAWPKRLDRTTLTKVLRGSEVSGLMWPTADAPAFDPTNSNDPRKVRAAVSVLAADCAGQRRPTFPANYAVFEGDGKVGMFSRPPGVRDAGREFMAERFAN